MRRPNGRDLIVSLSAPGFVAYLKEAAIPMIHSFDPRRSERQRLIGWAKVSGIGLD